METLPVAGNKKNWWNNVRIAVSLLGALLLFVFAIKLMVASLQQLGENMAQTILFATANPFNGLLIGLLITAMLQSSSTTTALTVAFVASGSISVEGAIPIIMGANVGTTITSTIVSLGFINTKKEFKRAVAAGTYHDFFNILTVIVLFPLQYYYGFLSSLSAGLAHYFFNPASPSAASPDTSFSLGFGPVIGFLIQLVPNGLVLAIFALILLFSSILIFRKKVSNLLQAKRPETFSRFFFKSQFKSFLWGVLTTAAIRSSTITTSVVVPIVAKKIATLKQAAPFILGANIGTTITAFIAATFYANSFEAITIALVHLVFNLAGVLLFFPIPFLRKLPLKLANGLGRLTLKYRLVGFAYLLSTFFLIPFTLIYINRNAVQATKPLHEQHSENMLPDQRND